MAETWHTGLVVGKFAPLHRGHQLLLETAAARVQHLHVLVYSNPEPHRMASEVRAGWLRQLYAASPGGELRIGAAYLHVWALLVDEVPPNAAPDQEHREFVRKWLAAHRISVDVIFSSEAYGPGFAGHLGAAHVLVDLARQAVPISGTALRRQPYEQAAWLHPVVAAHFHSADFVQKVVLMGAESTGKSTLTAALAEEYQTAFVAEYGRTLYEEKAGQLEYDDLLRIAYRHRELEEKACSAARHYLFVDTNAATTAMYSYIYFGRCEPALHQMAAACRTRYQHTFVCAPDFPYEQDGTRQPAELQEFHHRMILQQLDMLQIPYHLLTGPIFARLQQVRQTLADCQEPFEEL